MENYTEFLKISCLFKTIGQSYKLRLDLIQSYQNTNSKISALFSSFVLSVTFLDEKFFTDLSIHKKLILEII